MSETMREAFSRGARLRLLEESDLAPDFQARLLALCEADLNIEGLWLAWMTSPDTEPELHAALLAKDRGEQVARDFIRRADALGGPRFTVGFPSGIPKAKALLSALVSNSADGKGVQHDLQGALRV